MGAVSVRLVWLGAYLALAVGLPSAPRAQPAEATDGLRVELSAGKPGTSYVAYQPMVLVISISSRGAEQVRLAGRGWRYRGFGIEAEGLARELLSRQVPTNDHWWEDRYYLPRVVAPGSQVARTEMLLLSEPGEYRLRARVQATGGREYASEWVAVTVNPLPEHDPLVTSRGGDRSAVARLAELVVEQFYYGGRGVNGGREVQAAARELRRRGEEGATSSFTESVVGVYLLVAARERFSFGQRLLDEVEPAPELIQQCGWFENQFPDSPLLPDVRYRKAVLLYYEGREAEAKALLREERERSPIARLLYANFAARGRLAARLLKDEE